MTTLESAQAGSRRVHGRRNGRTECALAARVSFVPHCATRIVLKVVHQDSESALECKEGSELGVHLDTYFRACTVLKCTRLHESAPGGYT